MMELVLASEEAPVDVQNSGASGNPSDARDGGLASDVPLGDSQAPIFGDLSLVQIHGLEKKPELNEQLGVVLSFDGGADRRYTVKVCGSMVRLREDKLRDAPAGWEVSEDNDVIPALSAEERAARAAERAAARRAAAAQALHDAGKDEKRLAVAIEDAKFYGIDVQQAEATLKELQEAREKEQARLLEEARKRDEANIEFMKSCPQGQVTSTGRLVPTYSWAQVPAVASLPQGMEVWMLAGFRCARIPESWRLQIVADGQTDSFRVDVGENTLVADVLLGAASRFGWPMRNLQLQCDGKDARLDNNATVGSAGLFGVKLTARRLL